jgi:hypothetical protein
MSCQSHVTLIAKAMSCQSHVTLIAKAMSCQSHVLPTKVQTVQELMKNVCTNTLSLTEGCRIRPSTLSLSTRSTPAKERGRLGA